MTYIRRQRITKRIHALDIVNSEPLDDNENLKFQKESCILKYKVFYSYALSSKD